MNVDTGELKVTFHPLTVPRNDARPHLKDTVTRMERRRSWTETKTLLGKEQAARIESTISLGNSRIVEIGAGHLEASKELAKTRSSNTIIAVEPFVEDPDLLEKPDNLLVIPKAIENISVTDIPDETVDVVFSGGHTWNYIDDKLRCVQRAWQMLKPGGFGVIEFIGQYPINPPMQEIIDRFGLNDLIRIVKTGEVIYAIVIEKSPGKQLSFGKYSCRSELSGNLPGDVNSFYEFE